jgi:3-phenylpropionate/cinnamic acid dioxygenase small subunit
MSGQPERGEVDSSSQLRDERDVLDVVHRFAAGMDLRDWDAYRAVFADELVLDYTSYRGGEPTVVPADAWVDRVRRRFLTLLATQHSLSNHRIEVDGDDARCQVYVQAMHVGEIDGVEHWCVVGGQYDDLLARTAGGWHITRKKLEVRWVTGDRRVLDLQQP